MPVTPDYIARHVEDVLVKFKEAYAEAKKDGVGLNLFDNLKAIRAAMQSLKPVVDLSGEQKKKVVMLAWDQFQVWIVSHDNPWLPDTIEKPLDYVLASDAADMAVEFLYDLLKNHAPVWLGL